MRFSAKPIVLIPRAGSCAPSTSPVDPAPMTVPDSQRMMRCAHASTIPPAYGSRHPKIYLATTYFGATILPRGPTSELGAGLEAQLVRM